MTEPSWNRVPAAQTASSPVDAAGGADGHASSSTSFSDLPLPVLIPGFRGASAQDRIALLQSSKALASLALWSAPGQMQRTVHVESRGTLFHSIPAGNQAGAITAWAVDVQPDLQLCLYHNGACGMCT
jgi:hypothetical protein